MKRIIALALVLCTGISLFTRACAEAAPVRFVTNAMNLVEDWLEEHHPDIKYENLYDTADSWRTGGAHTGRVLDALQSEDSPDLLLLESSLCDFEKVLKSGLVEDLSGHQGIRAALSQMYEPFQSFVTGEDGGIYGVLYGVYGLGMHVIPAAWELDFALPLTFIALLAPALKDRAGVVAALVGGVAAVLAFALPYKMGILVAALAGIGAGMLVEGKR